MEYRIALYSCMSPCSSDFIISLEQGAWRKVSEDSGESRPFLLIDCTERIFTTAFLHRRWVER